MLPALIVLKGICDHQILTYVNVLLNSKYYANVITPNSQNRT